MKENFWSTTAPSKCDGTISRLVIFLDWSQYGAPGWTEAYLGVDPCDLIGGWSGSKVVELLEL